MSKNPRLIFSFNANGRLSVSVTGPKIEGVRSLGLDFESAGKPLSTHLMPQIMKLQSPTGIIKVEFPNEQNTRSVAVTKTPAPAPAPVCVPVQP